MNRPELCLNYNTIVTHLPLEKYNTLSLYIIFYNQSHIFERRLESNSKPTYVHRKETLDIPRDKGHIRLPKKLIIYGTKRTNTRFYFGIRGYYLIATFKKKMLQMRFTIIKILSHSIKYYKINATTERFRER